MGKKNLLDRTAVEMADGQVPSTKSQSSCWIAFSLFRVSCFVCSWRIWWWLTTMSGVSLDGVTLLFPSVGTRRSQGIGGGAGGAGCRVSASHLAHLIVLSGLTVVPLGLCLALRLPLCLPLAAVAPVSAVAVRVLGLVLHLRASMLLRSSSFQSPCQRKES